MTLFSYAQNLEDVVLQRVFVDVKNGFYVDAGANHHTQDSVTRALYDQGWRGINIEPAGEWYASLVTERPEDVNLNVALGHEAGIETFYEISGTGLSTFSKEYADRAEREHHFSVKPTRAIKLTLTQILSSQPLREIHFLKVDTEGTEESVIRGMDLERFRPWVIVVEATEPLRQSESHLSWEELLLSNRYSLAYCDGLNRFYLAAEQEHLRDRFRYPPNVFDKVIPHHLKMVLERLWAQLPDTHDKTLPDDAFGYYQNILNTIQLTGQISQGRCDALVACEKRISDLEYEVADAWRVAAEFERQLLRAKSSRFYRFGKPFRKVATKLKKLTRRHSVETQQPSNPRNESKIRSLLRKLEQRIRGYRKSKFGKTKDVPVTNYVSPRAKQIVKDLQDSIDRHRAA